MSDILKKIKEAGLVGRGGAAFPTHLKWQAVKNVNSDKKYLIVNGAEGEPGIHKDEYILINHLNEFCLGLKLAADYVSSSKIFFYLSSKYFNLYKKNIINNLNKVGLKGKFEIIKKTKESGYIGGEESTILNILEGKILEPRLKPPFPTEHGLWSAPTLIQNIETLYNVYLVDKNKFKNTRFYSINVGSKNKGVYSLADDLSIAEVLQQTNFYPKYKFFVQIGGDAAGEVLNDSQLEKKVSGAGSITIYNLIEHNPERLVAYWLDFFVKNSCGQCTPCREGTYRLKEMLDEAKTIKKMLLNDKLKEITDNLFLSSFCALGLSVPIALLSYLENVYKPNIKLYE
jgi:NADH:ubiquinone oxidoreductase subunit F (NADH-binding)